MLALMLALTMTAAAEEPLGQGLNLRGRYQDPRTGLEIEAGDLGNHPGAPLLGTSPYFSVGKSKSGSGTGLDWSLSGRAAVVDANARWFSSAPGADPLIRERGAPNLTGYQDQQLYFFSVLGTVGRAYNLYGPVDVAWNALAVGRLNHMFPNAALDQTVSARLRLPEGHSVGVFAGVTETAALLSDRWAQSVANGGQLGDPRIVTAPHAEIGMWGERYRVFAGMQKNPMTTASHLHGSVLTPVESGVVSTGLRFENEKGFDGDFSRTQRALRVALSQRGGVEWGVEAGRRHVGFGGAQLSDSFIGVNLTLRDKTGETYLVQKSMHASQGVQTPTPAWAGQLQSTLNQSLSTLDVLLKGIDETLAGASAPQITQRLRDAYGALRPELRAAIEAEVGPLDFDRIGQALADQLPSAAADAADQLARARQQLAQLQAALTDPRRLENIVTRSLRVELYQSLVGTRIRLWGRDTPLTPGLLLAAVHAYGQGPATLAPMPRGVVEAAVDRELAERLRLKFGLTCGAADVVACALSGLPAEIRDRLNGLPAQKARELIADAVGLVGETLRLEANRFLLTLMESARRFDVVDVTRGQQPGLLSRDAHLDSYARLDRRRQPAEETATWSLPVPAMADRALETLRAEQARDAEARRARLEASGARLRAELREAGIDAPADELAVLIGSGYGYDALREFAAAAKARLDRRGPGKKVLLRSAPTVAIVRDVDFIELRLPPAQGREPGKMLDAVVSSL